MVLLAFVGLMWVVMGVGSTAKYFQSEDHIGKTLAHMVEAGKTATIEQCVDEMLMNALYDAPVDAEGKQLFVDWSDGGQLSAPYICDGKSLMLKRSSGNQTYSRVR